MLTFIAITFTMVVFRAESLPGTARMLGAMLGANGLVLPQSLGDVAGSADYPLIGRFENSTITFYEVADFDDYVLFTGAPASERQVVSAMAPMRICFC